MVVTATKSSHGTSMQCRPFSGRSQPASRGSQNPTINRGTAMRKILGASPVRHYVKRTLAFAENPSMNVFRCFQPKQIDRLFPVRVPDCNKPNIQYGMPMQPLPTVYCPRPEVRPEREREGRDMEHTGGPLRSG